MTAAHTCRVVGNPQAGYEARCANTFCGWTSGRFGGGDRSVEDARIFRSMATRSGAGHKRGKRQGAQR